MTKNQEKILTQRRKDNMMKKLKKEGFDSFLYSHNDFRSDKEFIFEVLRASLKISQFL